MIFNLKEQIIALSYAGLSLKQLWSYTERLNALGLLTESLYIEDMEELLEGTYSLAFLYEKKADIRQLSRQAILFCEPSFPKAWRHVPQPPIVLYYEGDLSLLEQAPISIIGSRKYTPYGEAICECLVDHLLPYDFTIVSGLAKGIDTIAQKRAAQIKKRSTIAILPTAFDHYYPRENQALQKQLMKEHLVLSEYLPQTPIRKHHFIMRNRLVASLSPACLLIEAAKRSGSLITANYALQFNKEVYALPGRISDSQSQGTNELIQAGAQPILSMPQILRELSELYIRQGHKL